MTSTRGYLVDMAGEKQVPPGRNGERTEADKKWLAATTQCLKRVNGRDRELRRERQPCLRKPTRTQVKQIVASVPQPDHIAGVGFTSNASSGALALLKLGHSEAFGEPAIDLARIGRA